MGSYHLKQPYGESLEMSFKPGMAWAIYTDDGPSGPCGQSMSITCPHTVLFVFRDEQQMRDKLEESTRHGKRQRICYGVIGEYTSGGEAYIVDFTNQE